MLIDLRRPVFKAYVLTVLPPASIEQTGENAGLEFRKPLSRYLQNARVKTASFCLNTKVVRKKRWIIKMEEQEGQEGIDV